MNKYNVWRIIIIDPSVVCALPLAASTQVVNIVLGIFFSLLSEALLFYQKEGS
jgi:hypothetical protein